jgi:hypothetical protein
MSQGPSLCRVSSVPLTPQPLDACSKSVHSCTSHSTQHSLCTCTLRGHLRVVRYVAVYMVTYLGVPTWATPRVLHLTAIIVGLLCAPFPLPHTPGRQCRWWASARGRRRQGRWGRPSRWRSTLDIVTSTALRAVRQAHASRCSRHSPYAPGHSCAKPLQCLPTCRLQGR